MGRVFSWRRFGGVGALVWDKGVSSFTGAGRDVLGCQVLRSFLVCVSWLVEVLLRNFDAVSRWDDWLVFLQSSAFVDVPVHNSLVDNAAWRDLAEHIERVEPSVDRLEPDSIVNLGDSYTVNLNGTTVCLGRDLFALAVVKLALAG